MLYGLMEEGIIGNDILDSHRARINYHIQQIHLMFEGMERMVRFRQEAQDRSSAIRIAQIICEGTEWETVGN